MAESKDLTLKEKIEAIKKIASFRPVFTSGLVLFSAFVAVFEGIGLGFIHPILEVAQQGPENVGGGTVMTVFLTTYEALGIPFTLGYLIIGVSLIMISRYTMSFVVGWLKSKLAYQYEKELREKTFSAALDGKISYFDKEGSDNILNAIITETDYSSRTIIQTVEITEKSFIVAMYLAIMLYISPFLTFVAILVMGGITVIIRYVIEPGVKIGSRVAKANEEVQEHVQAGTQGIKDVKLFGVAEKIYSRFNRSINNYKENSVRLERNKIGIEKFYNMTAAIALFGLIYIGFEYTELELSSLGIFLIAMFRLAPRISTLNSNIYKLEGFISHFQRTQEFLQELRMKEEEHEGEQINHAEKIEFENVEFSYEKGEEKVLNKINFKVEKDDFIAFVGQSGAGKSTIVSLISRMYDPDQGRILANNRNIQKFDIDQWRERIAVVRQDPYIFNTTLEENIKIGNPQASREEVEKMAEIAKIDEYLDDLPKGFKSELGDNGVKLSGGQKQRVAIARALLKDSDFLILDEATSDLDSQLEKQVQENIEQMDSDYGIIAIAHQLSTIQNADTIHVIEKGEITETGTHQQLMKEEGKYAELKNMQESS